MIKRPKISWQAKNGEVKVGEFVCAGTTGDVIIKYNTRLHEVMKWPQSLHCFRAPCAYTLSSASCEVCHLSFNMLPGGRRRRFVWISQVASFFLSKPRILGDKLVMQYQLSVQQMV